MDIPQVTAKVDAATGEMGQQHLATGKQVALCRWETGVCEFGKPVTRDYATVGYPSFESPAQTNP